MDSHKFRDKQSQTTQTPFDEPLTGMDVSPQLEIYPTAEMTEERKNTLWRVTPFSLVPIPTATAMLLIGSQRYHADCFFPLAQALTISGTISLSLVVMSAVAVAVVGWIFDEPYLTNGTKMLLRGLERLSQFLAFAQFFIIVVLTAVWVPNIMGHDWQYTNEEDKGTYCPFSEVVFTGLLLAMTWSFVGIAAAVLVFLRLPSWMIGVEVRDLDEESASFVSAEEFCG